MGVCDGTRIVINLLHALMSKFLLDSYENQNAPKYTFIEQDLIYQNMQKDFNNLQFNLEKCVLKVFGEET